MVAVTKCEEKRLFFSTDYGRSFLLKYQEKNTGQSDTTILHYTTPKMPSSVQCNCIKCSVVQSRRVQCIVVQCSLICSRLVQTWFCTLSGIVKQLQFAHFALLMGYLLCCILLQCTERGHFRCSVVQFSDVRVTRIFFLVLQ